MTQLFALVLTIFKERGLFDIKRMLF